MTLIELISQLQKLSEFRPDLNNKYVKTHLSEDIETVSIEKDCVVISTYILE